MLSAFTAFILGHVPLPPKMALLLSNVVILYNQLSILKDMEEMVTVLSEVKIALSSSTLEHQRLPTSVRYV